MMKIFYQGNNVHSLIGHGAAPETITVQGRVLKCTAFDSRYVHYSIPRGEYECQKVPNPFLFSETTFIALCGTPEGLVIGATLGSISQWSGEAWDEYEI